jgi:protein-S-isoprenylcysteine O-methyltransferase Ste14
MTKQELRPGQTRRGASDFEVRHRSLVLISIYLFAFAFWPLDRHDVAGYLRPFLPAGRAAVQLSFLIAAVPAIFAAALGTWALAYLAGGAAERRSPGLGLVTAGPYRFVRHPMYLATLSYLLSFGFLLNRLGVAIVVVGGLAFLYRVTLREEAELAAAYGEGLERYRERVPRFFPALVARWPRGTAAADWVGGWVGGAYLWLFAGSLVVLAVSLKESLFYATLASGMVARVMSVWWVRRRVAAAT